MVCHPGASPDGCRMTDLFGRPDDAPAMTPKERRKFLGVKRKEPIHRGYFMPPGTGPQGKTCGSCRHLVRRQLSKVYLKCGLNEARWTGGPASDIRARSPACKAWKEIDYA